jgi:Mrp family chromosome partitioning ATPase
MGPETEPAFAESFRSLRTNLYRALPGEHGKVVTVTSPMPSDGKTTCALSLAAMLAADNRRVLVIDANVRHPSHHQLFGIPQDPGLKELLAERAAVVKDSIRTLCLSVGWFDSLTCSAGANAEILSAQGFAGFLVEARSRYDFIIVDAPSYPVVSDPLVLAPLSDFVLSVFRLGNTSRKLAEEHLAGMYDVARGCAVVVNNAAPALAPSSPRSMPPSMSEAFRRARSLSR